MSLHSHSVIDVEYFQYSRKATDPEFLKCYLPINLLLIF